MRYMLKSLLDERADDEDFDDGSQHNDGSDNEGNDSDNEGNDSGNEGNDSGSERSDSGNERNDKDNEGDDEDSSDNNGPPTKKSVPDKDVVGSVKLKGSQVCLEKLSDSEGRVHFEGVPYRLPMEVGRNLLSALQIFKSTNMLSEWLQSPPSAFEFNQRLVPANPRLFQSEEVKKLENDLDWNRAIDAVCIVTKVEEIYEILSHRFVSDVAIREALRSLPELTEIGFSKRNIEVNGGYKELARLHQLFTNRRELSTYTPAHPYLPKTLDDIAAWTAKWTVILSHVSMFKGVKEIRHHLFEALSLVKFADKWPLTQQSLHMVDDDRYLEKVLGSMSHDARRMVNERKSNVSREFRKTPPGIQNGNNGFRLKYNKSYEARRHAYHNRPSAPVDFREPRPPFQPPSFSPGFNPGPRSNDFRSAAPWHSPNREPFRGRPHGKPRYEGSNFRGNNSNRNEPQLQQSQGSPAASH